MTPDQQREYDRLRRELRRRAAAVMPPRRRATPPGRGAAACHICRTRFAHYADWERHAATTGHDARRNARSTTRTAGPGGRVEFAAWLP